nr:helix-turn-helix domain-containing protein [Enterococcus ratti]
MNHLLFVHGSLPELKQEEFSRVMNQLVNEKLLSISKNYGRITALGNKKHLQSEINLNGLCFSRYGRTASTCWRLIKFAVQVVSYLTYSCSDYLPIETSPYYTFQVKRWIVDMKLDRFELASKLSRELEELFLDMPTEMADFLANQFSGVQAPGLLSYQLTEIKDEMQLKLYEAKNIHSLLKKIEEKKPLVLFYLIQPLLIQNYNQSMLITRKLVLEGHSLEEIMKIRHLKKGTVTDHLIEWQLYFDDFPYKTMISKKTLNRLSQFTNVQTLEYRQLNEQASLDYGEFRFYQIGVLKGELLDGIEG